MKTNHQPEQENLENLEQDAVWDLLEKAPAKQAGSMFSRNVMRAIRLEEEASAAGAAPWWKKMFSPKPMLAMGAAACCALAITALLPTGANTSSTTAGTADDIEIDAELEKELESLLQAQLDEEFIEELSVISSNDDSFLSADEIAQLSVSL